MGGQSRKINYNEEYPELKTLELDTLDTDRLI